MSRNVFIVDYAYGFNAKTCEVDEVCKFRSEAALRARAKYADAFIVLSAGLSELTGDCGPLAEMMQKYLVARGVPQEKILRNPLGFNTLTETEAAQAIIAKHGNGKVICATSAFHALRVWLIWLLRFGVVTSVYTTPLRPPAQEYLKEIRKIPEDMVRSLIHRIKNIGTIAST